MSGGGPVTPAAWRPPPRLIDVDEPGCAPELAARLVQAALDAEPGAVLVRPSPTVRAVLAALPRGVPAVAVLPDMPQLLRDASERGPARAVLARMAGGGVAAWWRLAATGVRHVRALAAQDFSGIVPVLIELERAGLEHTRVVGVALAAPLTDLLLAAGHADCLSHVVRFVGDRLGTAAGFETHNLGHLLRRLQAWGATADFVLGPFNQRGHRMKPSPAAVRGAVRATSIPVCATEVSAGGTIPVAAAVAFARSSGAASVVVTLADLGSRDYPSIAPA